MWVPLVNFERSPGVPFINFEGEGGGPGVLPLNLRGFTSLSFKLEGGPVLHHAVRPKNKLVFFPEIDRVKFFFITHPPA